MSRVLVLHDLVAGEVRADEADVLVQRDVVLAALRELGHEAEALACGLDLASAERELRRRRPELVFNLVESMARTGRLIHFAPCLLDALAIPYVGAPADAIYVTSNKHLAKRLLIAAGLPTPPSWLLPDLERAGASASGRVIVKSLWEHGSVGLDASSVIDVRDAHELAAAMRARLDRLGGEAIAESYVDGREFNLALLGGPNGPTVLPPAEIEFVAWDESAPRIVDWRAKWDESSHEYQDTPRRFDFDAVDAPLVARLVAIARAAWDCFGLRGWARVDFRVDRERGPFVLEVNTNPCLSPDAGFAAALQRAGIPFAQAIARILDDLPPR
ncbi:MAG: D-alanine--D-alanine ligase [Planctomycetes bacterium]|nr:D-alanine--D-alanine ligase [Planctomycetota bacterium]